MRVRGRGSPCLAKQAHQPPVSQLEQGLCCGRMEPPDGPAGIILECLVLSSGELEKELAGPILYLLEALDGEGPLRVGQVEGRDMGFPSHAVWTPLT